WSARYQCGLERAAGRAEHRLDSRSANRTKLLRSAVWQVGWRSGECGEQKRVSAIPRNGLGFPSQQTSGRKHLGAEQGRLAHPRLSAKPVRREFFGSALEEQKALLLRRL